mmetsp:Transcript_126215/g.365313  ORF Transcript_126215/g.365313 Transcript_126215/m.365313 type:complete len:331 (+) Transcript_126215:904-1896(+)
MSSMSIASATAAPIARPTTCAPSSVGRGANQVPTEGLRANTVSAATPADATPISASIASEACGATSSAGASVDSGGRSWPSSRCSSGSCSASPFFFFLSRFLPFSPFSRSASSCASVPSAPSSATFPPCSFSFSLRRFSFRSFFDNFLPSPPDSSTCFGSFFFFFSRSLRLTVTLTFSVLSLAIPSPPPRSWAAAVASAPPSPACNCDAFRKPPLASSSGHATPTSSGGKSSGSLASSLGGGRGWCLLLRLTGGCCVWLNWGNDWLLKARMPSDGPSLPKRILVTALYDRFQSFFPMLALSISYALHCGDFSKFSSLTRYGGPTPTVPWR